MTSAPRQTERTVLRRWTAADRECFAEMNSDPEVMKYFPAMLTREESDRLVDNVDEHFVVHGFGPWVLEIPNVVRFAGFVGLSVPRFVAPFTPCVEIGWRLARPFWGHGYVTEAARAALVFGFDELKLSEIVSFTVPTNLRSRRVMERLGMSHDERDDFEHPSLPEAHPLRRHVLYRKSGKAPPTAK